MPHDLMDAFKQAEAILSRANRPLIITHTKADGDALVEYTDELESLFKAALERALRRRRQLLRRHRAGKRPSPAALRRGWIAYAEYWAA